MLEVDADSDWWDSVPDKIKSDIEAAMAGIGKRPVTAHETIQKRYKKWLVK